MKIIDYYSRPPTPELAKSGAHMNNYGRVYGNSQKAAAAGSDHGGDDAAAALASYLRLYDELDADGVVIRGRDVETTFGLRIRNEDVAAFCREHGSRYIGFAGVDPHKGMEAIRDLRHAVETLGLKGLNLQPFEHKLRINDPKMFPLYAKCIELDIPLNLHCSTNFSVRTLMDYGHPRYLDEVMVHFPELRVCASPPGWPWALELIAVAWRHSNVFIGVTTVRPKYLDVDNSGYEPLLQYGKSVLQDQFIWGSSWPNQPIERSLSELSALAPNEAVRTKWLGGNAARFLGI